MFRGHVQKVSSKQSKGYPKANLNVKKGPKKIHFRINVLPGAGKHQVCPEADSSRGPWWATPQGWLGKDSRLQK